MMSSVIADCPDPVHGRTSLRHWNQPAVSYRTRLARIGPTSYPKCPCIVFLMARLDLLNLSDDKRRHILKTFKMNNLMQSNNNYDYCSLYREPGARKRVYSEDNVRVTWT